MRRALGMLRRWSRLALPDIYLLLTVALIRRHRFDDAAVALRQALNEEGGIREDEALLDVSHAAHQARAHELELWAQLELALRVPERADSHIQRARALLDAEMAADGVELVRQWQGRAVEELRSDQARFEVALLLARASLLMAEDEEFLDRLGDAAAIAPDRAGTAARDVMNRGPLPPRLTIDDPSVHWLRARAYDKVNSQPEALEEAGAVLRRLQPSEDLGLRVRALELRCRALSELGPPAEAAAAFLMLGQQLRLSRNYVDAVRAFERATQIEPTDAVYWWYLADSKRMAITVGDLHSPDLDMLKQAWVEWNRGLAIRHPLPHEAWACSVGALIAESLAFEPEAPGDRLWEAVQHSEEAAALDPDLTGPLVHLIRWHRWVGHHATAVVTSRLALAERQPDEALAREHLFTLAVLGLGDPVTAVRAHQRRFELAQDGAPFVDESWADGLRAYVLLHQCQAAEAERTFGAIIAAAPDDIWALAGRTLARALRGDSESAADDAERVLALTDKPAGFDAWPLQRGWAAFLVGDLKGACAAFESAAELLWVDKTDASLGLGCALLARGEVAGADAAFAQASTSTRHPRHLAAAQLALTVSAQRYPGVDFERARHALARAAVIADRGFDLDDALTELASTSDGSPEQSAAWAAAMLARSRLLDLAGRLLDAADTCQAVSDRRFLPGVTDRLVRVLEHAAEQAIDSGDPTAAERATDRLRALGHGNQATVRLAAARAHFAAGHRDEALAEVNVVLEARAETATDTETLIAQMAAADIQLALGLGDRADASYTEILDRAPEAASIAHAELETRRGLAAVARGDVLTARERLRTAVGLIRREQGRTAAARTVIAACEEVTARGDRPPLLDMVLRALMEDEALSGGQRRRISTTRFHELRMEANGQVGVLPLAIEAHASLLSADEVTSEVVAMLEDSIPATRERLYALTGIEIPGVRVAASDREADRTFRLFLHGVPHLGGHIPTGAALCLDVEACRSLGLDGVRFGSAWHGRDAAVWLVTPETRRAAAAADLFLLSPQDAMVWQLEGLVRLQLFRLVGMTEVDQLVQGWRTDGVGSDRSALAERALPNASSRIRFAALLRRLVREQVPVLDIGELIKIFAEFDDQPLSQVVDLSRAALRQCLPAICDSRDLVEVHDSCSAATAAAVKELGVLDREHARRLLGMAGTALVERPPAATALVVSDSRWRGGVQTAANCVAQSAAVLSAEETSDVRAMSKERTVA